MYLLGYDIGSSSVKVALVNAQNGDTIGMAQHPETEMAIAAPQPDWAEQHPADWWAAACAATRRLMATANVQPNEIAGIGIAYQMHGLVLLDKHGAVLRPAIIWCDSRAVSIGNQAFEQLGAAYCLEHYLNSPGNFTASKLHWVRENEPELFEKIDKALLPGDYVAFRMTGKICTTITGLSEGIFWDFKKNSLAHALLEHYQIPESMLPDIVPVFGNQGALTAEAAAELGLVPGIPIGYRAGDQPNNALSLNVLRPGEIAATGGTSGVVYAVSAQPQFDPQMRVNSFAHVNYTAENPLTGVLLCINGAGIAYRWAREHFGDNQLIYNDMEALAAAVPIGAAGLVALPFGNGAERMLGNQNPGATFAGIQFNRHEPKHFYRAVLEGIAFSFVHGIEAMREMGISVDLVRVGNDNLFQSAIFSNTIATLIGAKIETLSTNGAVGAAKASGVAAGFYASVEEALQNVAVVRHFTPDADTTPYAAAYARWKTLLNNTI